MCVCGGGGGGGGRGRGGELSLSADEEWSKAGKNRQLSTTLSLWALLKSGRFSALASAWLPALPYPPD